MITAKGTRTMSKGLRRGFCGNIATLKGKAGKGCGIYASLAWNRLRNATRSSPCEIRAEQQ